MKRTLKKVNYNGYLENGVLPQLVSEPLLEEEFLYLQVQVLIIMRARRWLFRL